MSWVKLDDGFHRNDKQMRMSHVAFRLYVCALSYCAQEREPTGYLTEQQATGLRRSYGIALKAIEELIQLNAWEPVNGGYLIHDYDEYVERGSRDRTRQWRERKRHGDVTVTKAGDVTPASLARDGYPVPKPVPVDKTPDTKSGRYSPREAANGLAVENPDVVAYGECFLKHGRTPSGEDLEVLRRIPYEFDRLSRGVVLEAIEDVAARFAERQKPIPKARYLLGKLADLQVRASENGVRPQARLSGGGGMTRISELLP